MDEQKEPTTLVGKVKKAVEQATADEAVLEETETTMFEDLLAVQKELPSLQKTSLNPHFNNRFIPLEELMPAILPILNNHGFVLLQKPTTIGLEPALNYTLIHRSGQQITDTMLLLLKNSDPQGQGSAITYARRYSVLSLLGLTAEADEDGQAASDQERQAAPTPAVAPAVTPGATKPVSEAQKQLLNRLVQEKLVQNARAPFINSILGHTQPADAAEASTLITALIELKAPTPAVAPVPTPDAVDLTEPTLVEDDLDSKIDLDEIPF